MAPRFRYLIYVSTHVLTPVLVNNGTSLLAGIIEGANDGRGRGRQGECHHSDRRTYGSSRRSPASYRWYARIAQLFNTSIQ
jgi:hypothetical protein